MKCPNPNCNSKNVEPRFTKENKELVFDNICIDCDCLFNDENDYTIV